MKRILVSMIMTTAMLILSGCGGGGGREKTVIQWLHMGAQENIQQAQSVKDIIEERYPDIRIDIIAPSGAGQSVRQKYLAMVAADDAPDIATFRFSWIGELIQRGVVHSLDDFYASDEFQSIKTNIYPPQILDLCYFGDNYYAVPGWINPVVAYYNIDLFDAAGYPHLKEGMPFDDFIEIPQQFVRSQEAQKSQVKMYGYSGDVRTFPVANGYTVINQEGTAANIDKPGFYNWIMFMKELIDDGVTPSWASAGEAPPDELFNTGRMLVYVNHHYMRRNFSQVEFDWDIIPVPLIDKQNGYSGGSLVAIGYVVSKDTGNYEAVKKLLVELVGGAYQTDMLQYISDMPILRKLQTDPRFLNATENPEHSIYYVDALEDSIADERYFVGEIKTAFWQVMNKSLMENPTRADIIEAHKAGAEEINALIAEKRAQTEEPYDNY
jgi:multiple sugar transport system substrate-binding protein